MLKKLFKFAKSPKPGKDMLTELDIGRVVGKGAQEEVSMPDSDNVPEHATDIEAWKQNDLDLLQKSWQKCCDEPANEGAVTEFRHALHNLHGASGAYGGGALTRLSGSLHLLVSGVDDLQEDAALINLHVQACRATAMTDGAAADDVADAVCDALEKQVNARITVD